ncbi:MULTISPECIES: DUF418 domain-containing protein [Pacificimonas]|nr:MULTISPECIES: DUF418 domain-containing protein [Pacificimonas]MBZ6377939.1 DUF418 domain-containing protein [Pacificimonas aurantium]
MSAPLAAPTTARDRLPFLDGLRGIAICGILFVNIWIMGSVAGIERDPRIGPSWTGLDQAVWWFQMVFVEGTMRGLLSMLFGAGFVLMASRGMGAATYYRRTVLLILFGLVHSYLLLWPGDILLIYGLAGLLLWFAKEMEPRQMIGAGVAGLVLLTGLGLGASAGLMNMRAFAEGAAARGADETDQRVSDWSAYLEKLAPSDDRVAESRQARAGGVAENVHYKVGIANELNSLSASRIWLFEPIAMMLLGGALMQLGILSGQGQPSAYRWMLAAGYGLGIPLNIAEWWQQWHSGFAAEIPMLLWSDQPGRVLVTLGHLGALGWLYTAGRADGLMRLFAPAGRLALTTYIGQTMICQWLLFPGFALDQYDRFGIAALWGLAILILGLQIAFSHIWLKHFRYGPLEWLWRWGTYGRPPPLTRLR